MLGTIRTFFFLCFGGASSARSTLGGIAFESTAVCTPNQFSNLGTMGRSQLPSVKQAACQCPPNLVHCLGSRAYDFFLGAHGSPSRQTQTEPGQLLPDLPCMRSMHPIGEKSTAMVCLLVPRCYLAPLY
jgi:hypothetical protein